MMSLKHPQTS
ncbi:hypothetical protein F383_38530 [Gossypium arboreum]|uniref:Uncharacterized protein n=1 Tax=Gossypium arboreum TaxID=29729 RepID=A0A0B0MFQ8_GOSAR|nr:hypothetical protein F383_38530 [Gossypium arboreum]